jgi:isoquinoline 1-oxidoreductase subunit alpha
MAFQLQINGKAVSVDAPDEMPLLWVLRDQLGMTGTKYGCGIAQCGACTVHVDGQAMRSCVTPASSVVGMAITTIEASTPSDTSTPSSSAAPSSDRTQQVMQALQQAWTDLAVPQCGYCQSGQIMAAAALLASNRTPTDADIDASMQGNLCRCASYQRIRAGIHAAAKRI